VGINNPGGPKPKDVPIVRKPPPPLGFKPRRRRSRQDELRAEIEESWKDEPADEVGEGGFI
jgi:hypothetical protein